MIDRLHRICDGQAHTGSSSKENTAIPDTVIISGSPKSALRCGGNGCGLRPALFPPHRILTLIVARHGRASWICDEPRDVPHAVELGLPREPAHAHVFDVSGAATPPCVPEAQRRVFAP